MRPEPLTLAQALRGETPSHPTDWPALHCGSILAARECRERRARAEEELAPTREEK